MAYIASKRGPAPSVHRRIQAIKAQKVDTNSHATKIVPEFEESVFTKSVSLPSSNSKIDSIASIGQNDQIVPGK